LLFTFLLVLFALSKQAGNRFKNLSNNKMGKIEMIIKKKIGKSAYTFVLSAPSFHGVVLESTKLSFGDVDNCGLCQSDDLYLHGHITKEDNFEYAYVRCRACRATLNFGQQKKDTSVVYLKTKTDGKTLDWMKYEKNINE
jgi:hypothetical protein